mgnify:CR=1 FL=1
MNLSDVQIMFYGKNIALNEVTVSNGIIIKGIEEGGPAFRSVRALADFIDARHAGA